MEAWRRLGRRSVIYLFICLLIYVIFCGRHTAPLMFDGEDWVRRISHCVAAVAWLGPRSPGDPQAASPAAGAVDPEPAKEVEATAR